MRNIKSILFAGVFLSVLNATWFEDIPRTITQPNGTTINCFITGDQYARRLHNALDYTIILNEEDGYFYYAEPGIDGGLIASDLVVGISDPQTGGLEPGYSISLELYNRKKEFYFSGSSDSNTRDAPTSGEVAQINVFIRFADDPDFPFSRSYYDAVFQTEDDEPSLRHYFWDVSYNTLMVNTFHYPGTFDDTNTSYIDEYNRSYYLPYSAANPDGYNGDTERTQREHLLLANAVNSISSNVSPFIDIDANDDGYVDAVSFVVYGQPGDWADLLWPHRWSLYSETVTINDAQVYDYLFMLSESWYFNVGVLSHEFGHVLGAPDYYHYSGGGAPTPVGGWDVMASNGNPPQFPSAFTKWKYFDWIDLPEITESGTYTLNPLQQQDNSAYKIPSPNTDSEYFVVEYRKQDGMYDENAPGPRSGLVVYRVNTAAGNGNAQGPPDELYVYRPDGTLNNNGNFDQAPYNSDYNHTQLNDSSNPSCFLYNNGSGADGGLNLYNVTEAGETISFTISFGVPSISVDPESLNFSLDAGEYETQTVIFSNSGEEETILNYEVSLASAVPFVSPQGGPDGGNYFWTTSDEEPGMDAEWIDIEAISTQLELVHNDQFGSMPIELPFLFNFYGTDYDYVEVNANGWIGWGSENEMTWLNGELPSSEMPRPAIFGFFDDLNPENNNGNSNSSGNVYYHVNNDRAVIWFKDVVRWNTTDSGQFDFQIILYEDGSFKTNYREMDGVITSGTVGFQNAEGSDGTLIVENEEFITSNMSWVASSTNGEIPWLTLSTSTGNLEGTLAGTESSEIYVQAVTPGMSVGEYTASINITSLEAEPVSISVDLSVTGENTTPFLPDIDISESDNGIVDLPNNINPLFSAVAQRYTHVVAPNGGLIQFLIQDQFTDTKVLHARRVLESYLKDIPESQWGANKSWISNAIANSNAILFLLNDEDEYENPDLWALIDAGVDGQDLLSIEVFPEGSSAYMNSTQRDATYEEILHFVHGYGIQLAFPALQDEIVSAMDIAIENETYNPLWDLPEEDYDEEYLAMGLECYFGLWAHDPNGNGYCGDQEYAFINREAMESGDSALYNIIHGFMGPTWEYPALLSQDFENEFKMSYQNDLVYTNRSRYLKYIALDGSNPVSILGNEYINNFSGNNGDNHFRGYLGDDVIFGGEGNDRAIFAGNREEYIIIPPEATEDSSYQILDIMPDRDGTDHLFSIEEVEFNGVVYSLQGLLVVDENLLPTEYRLYSAYPNPFNPETHIVYDIAEEGVVELGVYDIKGRMVRTLKEGNQVRGKYTVIWDAKDSYGTEISTGVYFIRLATRSYQKSEKVLFLK